MRQRDWIFGIVVVFFGLIGMIGPATEDDEDTVDTDPEEPFTFRALGTPVPADPLHYPNRELMEYLAASLSLGMDDPSADLLLHDCPRTYAWSSNDKLVAYQAQGGGRGVLMFQALTDPHSDSDYRLCIYENDSIVIASVFSGDEPDDIEVMDLESNGADEIFFHVHIPGGNSGNHNEKLYVVRPASRWIISLELVFGGASYAKVPTPQYSQDFFSPENRAAVELLEVKKWEYGYLDDAYIEANAPTDSAFADYFWMQDNDSVEDGPIRVREYDLDKSYGSCAELAEKRDPVQDGDYTYISLFKGPVIACNNKTQRFFVAFYPHISNRVTVIQKYGPYLFIGMRLRQGLAVLNLERRHLKRYSTQTLDIDTIAISDGIVRLNDSETLPMPTF